MRVSTPKKSPTDAQPITLTFSSPTKKHHQSSQNNLSLLSTSPNFHKRLASLTKINSKSPTKTPQVDLRQIFQRSPELFLKEDLGKTFDDTLARVYEAIIQRKNQKEDLDIKQEILMKEIREIEKEIPGLIMKKKQLLSELSHEKTLMEQYEGSLLGLEEKIKKKKEEIEEKEAKMKEKIALLNLKKSDIQQENQNLQKEILDKRNFTKQKIIELKAEADSLKIKIKKSELLEEEARKKWEKMKNDHMERVDKLKNKERTFFGMIKH